MPLGGPARATAGHRAGCRSHPPCADVALPAALVFTNGVVELPTARGLDVDLDCDALARPHEQVLTCGSYERDDTGYMRGVNPVFECKRPRW